MSSSSKSSTAGTDGESVATGSGLSSSDRLSRYAWLVVVLLFPVALLNYLDRQMLAAMKTSMVNDIPNINTQANWVIVTGKQKHLS